MSRVVGDAIFNTFVAAPRPAPLEKGDEVSDELCLTSSTTIVDLSARWVETPTLESLNGVEAARRLLFVEALVSEIHSWLGCLESEVRAPAGGKAWSLALRRAHRDGRRLMQVCRSWRQAAGSNKAFFGRLLVPICRGLPKIANIHGAATTWLTVDGGRIDQPPKRRPRGDDDSMRSRSRSPTRLEKEKKQSLLLLESSHRLPERQRSTTDDDRQRDLMSFEDDDSSLDYSLRHHHKRHSCRIPTEATVALWAAVGRLPNVACLELTRCRFAPNRSASPANVMSGPHLNLRTLCLYRCAGLTADVLADLVGLCPNIETLELHHACPWRKQHAQATGGLDDDEDDDDDDNTIASSSSMSSVETTANNTNNNRRRTNERGSLLRRREEQDRPDDDDSVAAWIAGVAMGSSRIRTIRLGDGVDDDALQWIGQLTGTALCSLNLMHTYALDHMVAGLRSALSGPRLLALSLHVDGKDQSCDDAVFAIAESASSLSLRVLALGDHVPVVTQAKLGRATNSLAPPRRHDSLTDRGLKAISRCRVLSRLMIDDAGAITVPGAATLLQTTRTLQEVVLRHCFANTHAVYLDALDLRDQAKRRHVNLFLEPRQRH